MSGALEKVVEAVRVLNHDTLSCNRVAANQWLVQFQHSHAAWEVATSLLTSSSPPLPPDYTFEAHVFAAQILRRKVFLLNSPFLQFFSTLVKFNSRLISSVCFVL